MPSREVPMLISAGWGALFILLALVNVVLGPALSQHRTDVPRTAALWSGPSRFRQVNMLVHAEYDPRGRAIKRWMVGILTAQCLLGVLLIAIWAL